MRARCPWKRTNCRAPESPARQYRILSDHMDIYRFMVELYERDWRNGVPAPFLEYARCG